MPQSSKPENPESDDYERKPVGPKLNWVITMLKTAVLLITPKNRPRCGFHAAVIS